MERCVLLYLLSAAALFAHPMGNFSVSHYSRFEVSSEGAALHYVLDLAEIPTFELLRDWGLDARSPREALEGRAEKQAIGWSRNLRIRRDGRGIAPRLKATTLTIADGAGGLPVVRVAADFEIAAAPGRLEYEDRNYEGRAGWKEIVVRGGPDAAILRSSHDAADRSRALTAYPEDPTVAPPQDLRASIEWQLSAPHTPRPPSVIEPVRPLRITEPQPQPGTVVRGDFLSELLSRHEIPFSLILAGIAAAFGLGAIHALSPGHGKTLVAAYLVGTRGTLKHAVFLGAMVTFTHTASVFALGLVTLFLSKYVVADKLYPVLGAVSGLSIVWVGASLLARRLKGVHGHHSHGHLHDQSQGHPHHHAHGDGHHHHHVPEGEVTLGSLIALGASGGLAPCPSALVLLLSSIALGRTGLGLVLLTGFSLGLSIVLMAVGALVVYAKHLVPDRARLASNAAFRFVPVVSAAVIICIGLAMTGVSLRIA